jgi:hypothetical protein
MRLANKRLLYWLAEGWAEKDCIFAARGYFEWLLSDGAWSEEAAEGALVALLTSRTNQPA